MRIVVVPLTFFNLVETTFDTIFFAAWYLRHTSYQSLYYAVISEIQIKLISDCVSKIARYASNKISHETSNN